MKWIWGFLVLGLMMGGLSGCAPPSGDELPAVQPSGSCAGKTITIGEVSEDPNVVITTDLPLANYLAKNLGELGYQCGRVKVVDTIPKMVTKLQSGEVDIYMDSVFPATLIWEATGAQPVLRRWRNCDPDYSAIVFTTRGSGITAVQDLPGRMIAMDRSYSTSGFVMPSAYLLNHGLNLVVKDAWNEPVASNEVGVFFSLDDKNTLNLLNEGKVSAAATDDYNFSRWEAEKPGEYVKLAEMESLPRQAVLVRADLPAEVQQQITRILLQADLDPEGKTAMQQAADTCKFDQPPDGIDAVFVQMLEMYEKIKTIPGWQNAYDQGH